MALMLCLTPAPISSQNKPVGPQQDYHRLLYDATFALYGQKDGDNGDFVRHFLCTATAVEKTADGYDLLTAGHCVTGEDLPPDLHFYVTENIVANPVLQTVTVDKAENSDKYDFALLHLKTARIYPVISVSKNAPSAIGSMIYNVNFSEGWAKQEGTGFVSSNVMTVSGAEGDCDICQGRFMVQVLAGPGASGSAIVDETTHQIIGLLEGGDSRAQIGAIVIPTQLLTNFLADSTVKIDAARDMNKNKK